MFQPLLGFLKRNTIHLRKIITALLRRCRAAEAPEVVPPLHGHQVAEPLMCQLLGRHGIDVENARCYLQKKGMRIQRDPKGDLEMDGINGGMYIYIILKKYTIYIYVCVCKYIYISFAAALLRHFLI